MQPRYYSFVNSPLRQPGVAVVAFSIVDVPLPSLLLNGAALPGHDTRRRRGVCSHWLAHLAQTHLGLEPRIETASLIQARDLGPASTLQVRVRYRPSPVFRLPTPDPLRTPLIMIGPGTGVAPFVGFLHHLQACLQKDGHTKPIAESWLFFGCRSPDQDFLYRDELLYLDVSEATETDTGARSLSQLVLAFSRASPELVYVQDRLRESGKDIVRIMCGNAEQQQQQPGRIYICGDALGMAKEVRQALQEIVAEHTHRSVEEAAALLRDWTAQQRLLLDVWH